jgi:hypothetical protein
MRQTVVLSTFAILLAACYPRSYNQPMCMINGVETMDEQGRCNGPPHPAWAYWERIDVPPIPRTLVTNDGGVWCGEGALPEHRHMWGSHSQGNVLYLRCVCFSSAPTRREWRNLYRFSVANFRYRQAQATNQP